MMKKLNNYFFDEDEICLSDFLWFYGGIGFMSLMGLLTLSVRFMG